MISILLVEIKWIDNCLESKWKPPLKNKRKQVWFVPPNILVFTFQCFASSISFHSSWNTSSLFKLFEYYSSKSYSSLNLHSIHPIYPSWIVLPWILYRMIEMAPGPPIIIWLLSSFCISNYNRSLCNGYMKKGGFMLNWFRLVIAGMSVLPATARKLEMFYLSNFRECLDLCYLRFCGLWEVIIWFTSSLSYNICMYFLSLTSLL